MYGYAAGDPANNSDPFGLCVDGVTTAFCIEGAIAATAIGVATTSYLAAHPEVGRSLAEAGSDATTFASNAWDKAKRLVATGIKIAGAIGAIKQGGRTGSIMEEAAELQKAKVQAAAKKKEAEDDRKKKEGESGPAGSRQKGAVAADHSTTETRGERPSAPRLNIP